jgi:hypothetical protein
MGLASRDDQTSRGAAALARRTCGALLRQQRVWHAPSIRHDSGGWPTRQKGGAEALRLCHADHVVRR